MKSRDGWRPACQVTCSGWLTPMPSEILYNLLFHSTSEYEKCFPSKSVSLMLTLQWDFILTHILWLPLQEGWIGCAQLSKPVHGSPHALECGVMGCLSAQGRPECKRGCPPGQRLSQNDRTHCLQKPILFFTGKCHLPFPRVQTINGHYAWPQNMQETLAPCSSAHGSSVLDILGRGGLRKGWNNYPSCGH